MCAESYNWTLVELKCAPDESGNIPDMVIIEP